MKLLVSLGLVLVLAIGSWGGGDTKDAAIKKELKILAGNWNVVRATYEGENTLEEGGIVLVNFKGDWATVTINGQKESKSVVSLDPTKNPKLYDEHVVDGAMKGKVIKGIYQLAGDTLTICYRFGDGKERPKTFDGKTDHVGLMVMKREKKEGGDLRGRGSDR